MSKLFRKLGWGKQTPSLQDPSPSRKPASRSRTLYSEPVSGEDIRILTLHPGIWTDPIDCELQNTPLQDAGLYKALSYTWNIESNDERVIPTTCNKLPLDITLNLYLGLRQLRDERGPVRLWVDAICINQKDDDERTCQVGMMRKIYETSTEVIIWLGETSRKDHLGEMVLPMLSAEEGSSLYQWQGDGRDYPKLRAYMSKEVVARREQALKEDGDMVDVFGAFRVMHALLSGEEVSDIQELRHVSKTGPILKGFDALMKQRWVGFFIH